MCLPIHLAMALANSWLFNRAQDTEESRPFCFTHPSNLCEVFAGAIINVRPLGIAEDVFVFEYICSEQCSIDMLSVSFCTVLSNHYNLPTRLFHLIWNDDDDGIIVNYIVQPVSGDLEERLQRTVNSSNTSRALILLAMCLRNIK
jgi:hypothetical protein